MTALDECHAKGFLWKAIGSCNDIKRDVNKCLSEQRAARAKANRDEARSKRKRIEAIWAEERGLSLHGPSHAATDGTGASKQ